MHKPANKKISDLVRRLHNEAKLQRREAPLLEEAATNLRLQAAQIERLQEQVLKT